MNALFRELSFTKHLSSTMKLSCLILITMHFSYRRIYSRLRELKLKTKSFTQHYENWLQTCCYTHYFSIMSIPLILGPVALSHKLLSLILLSCVYIFKCVVLFYLIKVQLKHTFSVKLL